MANLLCNGKLYVWFQSTLLLPYAVFLYFSFNFSAWWISARPRPAQPPSQSNIITTALLRLLSISNVTNSSTNSSSSDYSSAENETVSIMETITSDTFLRVISKDIFTGQIIATVIVLVFISVFLLREWISQNARPGVFEDVEPPVEAVEGVAEDEGEVEDEQEGEVDGVDGEGEVEGDAQVEDEQDVIPEPELQLEQEEPLPSRGRIPAGSSTAALVDSELPTHLDSGSRPNSLTVSASDFEEMMKEMKEAGMTDQERVRARWATRYAAATDKGKGKAAVDTASASTAPHNDEGEYQPAWAHSRQYKSSTLR